MPDLVHAVRQKLGIKYVDAKVLVAEARQVCEVEGNDDVPTERYDEVVEEACEIFADYPPDKQNSMKQPLTPPPTSTTTAAEVVIPAWKQKALAACHKLENDYESKQAAAHATEVVQRQLRDEGVPAEQIAATKVTHVRKLEEAAAAAAAAPGGSGPGQPTVRTYTCACVIQ
jgi:hypothetical protein